MKNKPDSYYVKIISILRTDNPQVCSMRLRYRLQKTTKEIILPLELITSPSKLLNSLVGANAALPSTLKERKDLVSRIVDQDICKIPEQRITTKSGFSEDGQFVLPYETIAKNKPDIFHEDYFSDLDQNTYMGGSLKEWKKLLSPVCEQSSLITFSIAVALTGPILHCFDPDIGISFNFAGPSGTGKTTAMRVAQSVLQRAKSGDIPTLNGTLVGAEELAFSHNDTFFCLDEFGTALNQGKNRKEISEFVSYVLCGGVGRRRAKSAAATLGYQNLRWRAALITSSEEPLNDLLGKRYPGEEVRLVEISIPTPDEHGIFDKLNSEDISQFATRDLAQAAEFAIVKNYGHAFRHFVRYLLQDAGDFADVAVKVQSKFVRDMINRGDASKSDTRLLGVFGKVAAAAVLASRAKVLPIKRKQALLAIRYAFLRTQSAMTHAQQNRLGAIRALADLSKDCERCIRLSKGLCIPPDKTGKIQAIIKTEKGREMLCIVPAHFKVLVGGPIMASVVAELKKGGVLIPSRTSNTRQVKIGGLTKKCRPRLYCFDLDKLYKFSQ
jgi:energy-coupling factor transporter ATP-binding protein EcfA2